jgi:Fe-S oxidoreductase
MNFLGIEPVVLAEERCCGHDLLWSGDRANFADLCRLNYQIYKDAGVKEIVTACPECLQVWQRFLPEVVEGFDLQVTLLTDLLEAQAKQGRLAFAPCKTRVTYQDPCRLARLPGRDEGTRALLGMIPELTLKEMDNHGRGALCCGNSAFINCDAFSKRIQVERLKEALATRAQLLVTSCPKCLIHLACAMRDPHALGSLAMELRALPSLLAERVQRPPETQLKAGGRTKSRA